MTTPPGDSRNPDDPEGQDNGGKKDDSHSGGPGGLPIGPKGRPIRIVISPSAQEVKFADLFGYTLTPTHGVIKFGTLQPETGEFVVHTQIAMTPQGMVALSEGLKNNIEQARKMKPGPGGGSKMN